MEGSVTIPIREYELLAGVKKDFDERLKSELKRMNEADRAFVLRDRDEYVRRNERLLKENSEKAEEIREASEMNVKLRGMRDSMLDDLAEERASKAILEARLDAAEQEAKRRDDNEKTLLDEVRRLREERRELLLANDALAGRGFFARLFNRRP